MVAEVAMKWDDFRRGDIVTLLMTELGGKYLNR